MAKRDYVVDGMKIDGTYGVPTEHLSCPGCGRKYTACKKACTGCEECERCCTQTGSCEKPEYLPAGEFITKHVLPKL